MLLIADNVDEKQKIVMADDGRGRLISIPSLFINYEDGTRLTEMLRKNTTVKILMKLEVNVTKVAEIRFWLSACTPYRYRSLPIDLHSYEGVQALLRQAQGLPQAECVVLLPRVRRLPSLGLLPVEHVLLPDRRNLPPARQRTAHHRGAVYAVRPL